jgi:two-component system, cell cycle sensor histidine kinase and response regulator CckA
LTCQLLLFSRKQIMQPRTLDLNASISELTRMLGRILGEDISLTLQQASHLPKIEADSGMIEQVIVNLVVNARDAMPTGGKLTLATSEVLVVQDRADRNPEARPGEFVRLTITDTGCGIRPQDLPRIFEPFFSTKPVGKGTGLGLSIVYGIIKQHRGWIEVSSEVNRGTSFHVFLPAVTRAAEVSIEPATREPLRGGTECVLVVEDESAVRQLVVRLLRGHGYRVLEAASGIEALPVWERHRNEIDLLLTDLVMPGGLSGRELAEKLRAQQPDLKVIYTSGYSTDFSDLESTLRGGIRFLPKPYHLPTLVNLLRECLDQ